MSELRTCPICWGIFDRGDSRRIYCSAECKKEARNRRNRRRSETRSSLNKARIGMSGIETGKLDQNLKEARSKGQSYAEWQIEQTLKRSRRGEL